MHADFDGDGACDFLFETGEAGDEVADHEAAEVKHENAEDEFAAVGEDFLRRGGEGSTADHAHAEDREYRCDGQDALHELGGAAVEDHAEQNGDDHHLQCLLEEEPAVDLDDRSGERLG